MSATYRTLLAAFVVVASAATTALAQVNPGGDEVPAELRQQLSVARENLATARSGLIRSFRVDGKELSADAIRREAVFLVGAKSVEARIAHYLALEQMKQQIAEGRPESDFEITEDQIVAELKDQIDQFRVKNPGVEFWEAIRVLTGMDRETFLRSQRETKLFDLVFFPGPAVKWPQITREAIMATTTGGDGPTFMENMEKASFDEAGNPRPLPPFWMQLCRNWVIKQLKKWSEIRFPSDGLPADVCLMVNELPLKTSEAFGKIEGGLFVQDLERAMTEVVVREALRQKLVEAGAYLSDEDFKKAYDEEHAQYEDTPFNTEVIATAFKGYPSLEAYRQRWRLIRSYQKMIEDGMTDEALQAHANQYSSFFADGSANVDVIQFFGRDLKTGAWLPGGMDTAEERATQAMKAIEDGASFDEVLADRGEFYANDTNKGRFGAKPLNQIRQLLRENEYYDLLQGYAVGDLLFFEVEAGKVVGPLRGPDAWFVARVNSKTPARQGVTIENERTRELVRQDYVNRHFLAWANEVLANVSVE